MRVRFRTIYTARALLIQLKDQQDGAGSFVHVLESQQQNKYEQVRFLTKLIAMLIVPIVRTHAIMLEQSGNGEERYSFQLEEPAMSGVFLVLDLNVVLTG